MGALKTQQDGSPAEGQQAIADLCRIEPCKNFAVTAQIIFRGNRLKPGAWFQLAQPTKPSSVSRHAPADPDGSRSGWQMSRPTRCHNDRHFQFPQSSGSGAPDDDLPFGGALDQWSKWNLVIELLSDRRVPSRTIDAARFPLS